MADHLQLPPAETPGGRRARPGPRNPPRSPRRHGGQLDAELNAALAASNEISIAEGVDPALVFRVRTVGRLSEEQWGSRGLELLTEGGSTEWDYVVLHPGVDPRALVAELEAYRSGPDVEGASAPLSSFFGVLEHIEPYGPDDRLASAVLDELQLGSRMLDAVIWPTSTNDEATHRVEQVAGVARRLGVEIVAIDSRARSPLVRLIASLPEAAEFATIPAVEVLRFPPTPYVDPSAWRDADPDDFDVERRVGVTVGVLDDAIAADHPLLQDVVVAVESFPSGHAWQPPGEHGTMVAGLAAYGDFEVALRDGSPLILGGPIAQGRVIEPDPFTGRHRFPTEQPEYVSIEQAIRTLHDAHGVRVFNLSVTEIDPYSGPHVSTLTETLDNLAAELDVVIVVPTGNHLMSDRLTATMMSGHHAQNDYAEYVLDEVARVSEPGTAALALTVGSLARSDVHSTPSGVSRVGYEAIAPADGISPFTRGGPGAFRSLKPDVVHYGGNWVLRPSGDLAEPEYGTQVISLSVSEPGRIFSGGVGTSFAAPRVARLAADILGAYPDASANLIRALIALSSRCPAPTADLFEGEDVMTASGHGLPDASRAIVSGSTRVVLTGEFELATDTVAIHPLPIPAAFHGDRARRSIEVALAFDPPVRRTRREYLAGTMSFDLLRASSMEQVAEWYGRQDPDDPLTLPGDRRRPALTPPSMRTRYSTLMSRRLERTSFPEDDGDTYFIAVTHQNRAWARDGTQRYALAVAFEEHERVEVDLYAELQARVRPRVRARAQLRDQ